MLRDGACEARLTFHLNTRGEIVRIAGLRPYQTGHNFLSQGGSGHYAEWQVLGGLRIPTRARVFWHLAAGEWEYWRGTIVSLSYSSPSP